MDKLIKTLIDEINKDPNKLGVTKSSGTPNDLIKLVLKMAPKGWKFMLEPYKGGEFPAEIGLVIRHMDDKYVVFLRTSDGWNQIDNRRVTTVKKLSPGNNDRTVKFFVKNS